MNREVKLLVSSLAKDLKLNIEDVERVYEAPFALQAIIMKYRCDREKKHFPSLRIPYFGLFFCPDWSKRRLIRREKQIETEGSSHQTI